MSRSERFAAGSETGFSRHRPSLVAHSLSVAPLSEVSLSSVGNQSVFIRFRSLGELSKAAFAFASARHSAVLSLAERSSARCVRSRARQAKFKSAAGLAGRLSGPREAGLHRLKKTLYA